MPSRKTAKKTTKKKTSGTSKRQSRRSSPSSAITRAPRQKAYGYIRVSTDEQAKEGVSLKVQRAKLKAFAELHDLKLIRIFADEGASGKDLERPGLQQLLELAKDHKAETVLVYKLDRLSRRTRDLLFLIEDVFKQGNTRLLSLTEQIDTDTAMGKFFLTLMAGLAQMERELISERTRSALQYKKERGERLGTTPYGYRTRDDGKLVKVPREMVVVRRIKKMRRGRSKKSYSEIARTLNDGRGADQARREVVRVDDSLHRQEQTLLQ